MWKSLHSGEKVQQGDKLRYTGTFPKAFCERLFEVVKTDQYYFEIICAEHTNTMQNSLARNIVKYFDIGHHISLEVWINESSTQAALPQDQYYGQMAG